jgi:hypothetical protein
MILPNIIERWMTKEMKSAGMTAKSNYSGAQDLGWNFKSVLDHSHKHFLVFVDANLRVY